MSTAPSFAVQAVRQRRLPGVMASRPLWIALAVTALISVLRLTDTVDSDVASQLWIASRIHAGAKLYRDIIEVNPPLWFWMAVPIERLAAVLHLRAETVLIAVFGLLVALSAAATDQLTGYIAPPRRTLFLTYVVLILAAMPWLHVGQREQIVLIGAIPYAAVIAARRERRRVSMPLAIAVGAAAALGFALKHYFLIVPALLELWLLSGARRRWRPVRPETMALVAIGLVYAAALVVEHDYLTRMVPLLRLAYGEFGPRSFRNMFGPFAIVAFAIIVFVAAHARLLTGRKAPLASALLAAALGFAISYFVQFKGWPYHTMPMLGCGALALAALYAETASPPALLRTVGVALLAMPLLISADEAVHAPPPNGDVVDSVAGLHAGERVAFLTTETAIPSSVVLAKGLSNPSRYNGIWMMQAVIDNELRGNPNPRIAAFGKQVVADTVVDFRCRPPLRIVAARPRPGEPGWDILLFFERDPQFVELLSHYRVRSRTSFETYEIVSRPRSPSSPCRKGL